MSETGDVGGSPLAPTQPELVLSGQQQALLAALRERDQQAEVMYAGALYVLRQTANPDRIALAAHALRELMEKLPEHLDVPAHGVSAKGQASLNVKVRELASHWTPISSEAEEATEVSPKLRRFHRKAKSFFEWFDQSFQKRRDKTAAALRAMDASGRYMPQPIEELRISHWGVCNDFFQGVSHHRKTCTELEFNAWLDDLERFLLDHLRPRTFEDFSSLDKIIAEGEQDA